MKSFPIHQNIYKIEKYRKGFTRRQRMFIAAGAAAGVGICAALHFLAGWDFMVAFIPAIVVIVVLALIGYVKPGGILPEEFAGRLLELRRRGNVVVLKTEAAPVIGEAASAKEQKKKERVKGYECG